MSDKSGYSGTGDKADLNNHANQLNPNHPEHKGGTTSYTGTGTQADLDNRADQLNPNNQEYGGGKKKWSAGCSAAARTPASIVVADRTATVYVYNQ